jgi:colicin import membrane protein
MGKNSLIKSTTKGKKSAAKKKAAKKTAAKAKAVAKTKVAAKKKAAAKTKAAPKPKAAVKKAAPKAKVAAKAAPAPAKKPVSVKDLLQKKFPVWKPEKLYSVAPDKGDVKDFSAPPIVSGSEEEQKRVKELLMKKFDMAEIRAAGEKAAAEKAAAEKVAAEKAAAEKAAAEKAAAEKAAEPEVSVSYEPPDSDDTIPSDPMDKALKYVAAAFAVLIALVVGSSMINQGKYYIQSKNGALKIFQGRFAPMGEKLMISLPGVQAPKNIKDVYSKTDVYPIIFNYYVEKADTLLKVPGLPDFEGIKKYINKARPYAITPASKDIVYKRLSNIDLLILLYKADVAASKSTLADLKEAKGYLSEASRLDIDDMQIDLVDQKMNAVDKKIDALKAKQKKVKSPAPAALAPTHAPPAKTEAPAHEAPAPAPHGEAHG